jgi:ABC-type branched-subunit amino acid transport system permease subunit
MFQKSLLLGMVSGALAGVAGIVYARVYFRLTEVDFSPVASTFNIFTASLAGGIIAAVGFILLERWLKSNGEIVFNLLFTILSFASLLKPISHRLPLTITSPELFPGLAIPMHFFPALGWYTLKPLFFRHTCGEHKPR